MDGEVRHFIYGALTGRTCDDAGACAFDGDQELKELFYVQSDATFRGAETKATLDLLDNASGKLQILGLADYVRATLEDGGNVPRIPPYHVGVGMNWDSGVFGAGFLCKYSGRQDDLAVAETPTAGLCVTGRAGQLASDRRRDKSRVRVDRPQSHRCGTARRGGVEQG